MEDDRTLMEKMGLPNWVAWIGYAFAVLIVIVLFKALFIQTVSSNEACVHTRFKKVVGTFDSGFNLKDPFSDAHCYTRLKITYEASLVDPSESDSNADYVDYAILARTKEGIDVRQPFVVQYHIDPAFVETFYKTQYRSMERIQQQVVNTHVRAVVPQIMSTYDAQFLYSGNLKTVSDSMLAELQNRANPQGVIIDYFELKRGRFDEKYEEAIRGANQVIEETRRTNLLQNQATEEAERLRIEAEGKKNATIIAAEADAEAVLIRAQADADAEQLRLEQRASVISQHPELITWQQIETIKSANVIYLPSDVLPIITLPNGDPAKQ